MTDQNTSRIFFPEHGGELVPQIAGRALGFVAAGGATLYSSWRAVSDVAQNDSDGYTVLFAAAAIGAGYVTEKFRRSYNAKNAEYRAILYSDDCSP